MSHGHKEAHHQDLEPPTRVGRLPPSGKWVVKFDAHPLTEAGFDDTRTWFKNHIQRDQGYIQKRNLPTHRVMPYDRFFNLIAYVAAAGAFTGGAYSLFSLMTKKYPPL